MARPTHHAKPATAMESFLPRPLDPVDRLVEGIVQCPDCPTFTLAFNVYQVQTEVGAQEGRCSGSFSSFWPLWAVRWPGASSTASCIS